VLRWQAFRKKAKTMKDHEIALRLANIEALLHELLDRRRATVIKASNRRRAITERLKATSMTKARQPTERHFAMARDMINRR
jgi:hypothetical protein